MSPVSSVPVRSVRKPASSAASGAAGAEEKRRAKLGLGTIMRSAQATFAGAWRPTLIIITNNGVF